MKYIPGAGGYNNVMAKILEINPTNHSLKGPITVTGFFVSTLEQHFFHPDSLFDDALKDILFRPDHAFQGTTDTKIYIAPALKSVAEL